MSAQNVVLDISALKDYKRKLTASQTQQAELMQRMRQDLNAVGHTWKDQQYTRFRELLEQRMKATTKFISELDETIKYIDGLIQRAEAIASHRL